MQFTRFSVKFLDDDEKHIKIGCFLNSTKYSALTIQNDPILNAVNEIEYDNKNMLFKYEILKKGDLIEENGKKSWLVTISSSTMFLYAIPLILN